MSNDVIFFKENPEDKIWSVAQPFDKAEDGPILFSFDKKKIFNAWKDYPYNLTPEQKEIFDEQFPFWADFFRDR